jgi:hypothetical protein
VIQAREEGLTRIFVDADADGGADFQLDLTGAIGLQVSDLIL